MPPVSLSDDELAIVMDCAAPLAPEDLGTTIGTSNRHQDWTGHLYHEYRASPQADHVPRPSRPHAGGFRPVHRSFSSPLFTIAGQQGGHHHEINRPHPRLRRARQHGRRPHRLHHPEIRERDDNVLLRQRGRSLDDMPQLHERQRAQDVLPVICPPAMTREGIRAPSPQ